MPASPTQVGNLGEDEVQHWRVGGLESVRFYDARLASPTDLVLLWDTFDLRCDASGVLSDLLTASLIFFSNYVFD